MKTLLLLITITILTSCTAQYVSVNPTVPFQYFRRMAILPFNGNNYNNSTDGVDVADGLQTKLVEQVPQLELVERQRLNDICKEWNLVRQGIVDINTAVAVGKLVGARLIMTGQIKDITVIRAREQLYGSLRVSVRVIDVERGIIIWAKEVKVTHPGLWSRYSAYADYTGTTEFKADMIEKVCDQIAKNFYPHEERVN